MSFCSNCGKPLNANLNYCSSCGTRVESNPLIVKNSSAGMMGIGSVFVACVGLMAFFPILRELLHSPLETGAVVVILIAYLVTVLLMFAVLVGHVWKNSGDIRIKGNRSSEGFGGQHAFRGVNTAQLPEPTSQPASVTEHTTRTLEEVPFKRN
jgi:hypothetical protein